MSEVRYPSRLRRLMALSLGFAFFFPDFEDDDLDWEGVVMGGWRWGDDDNCGGSCGWKCWILSVCGGW